MSEEKAICSICEAREAFSKGDNSPVAMIFHEMQTKMECGVVEAFQQIDINIDKAGVIRALEADRMRRAGELVEVVRCKDCKWRRKWKDEKNSYYCAKDNIAILGTLKPNFYCGYGKRGKDNDRRNY